MFIINILVGAALLLFGRRLFWLFMGSIGFILTLNLASRFFQGQPTLLVLMVAIGVGIIGAILVVFVEQIMIGLAGFLVGGYLLTLLLTNLHFNFGELAWLPFIIGGIIGAALVALLFEWAIIFLSTLLGGVMIIQVIHLNQLTEMALFILMVGAGIAFQATALRRRPVSQRVSANQG